MAAIIGIRERLKLLENKEKARILQRFFKTGPGEYGAGDLFLGIPVPDLRKIARDAANITLDEVFLLLQSKIHEERFLALLLLIGIYRRGDEGIRKAVYEIYMNHSPWINSWDLIDVSAEHIVGCYLRDKDRTPLFILARSERMWERRMAVMATFCYIKAKEFSDTLELAKILLSDKEDLIHKAMGWMLREIGKRNMDTAEAFLKEHYARMPRTMLRYAIEKFPKEMRMAYLKGTI